MAKFLFPAFYFFKLYLCINICRVRKYWAIFYLIAVCADVLNPGPKRIPQNLIKGKLYIKNEYNIICTL